MDKSNSAEGGPPDAGRHANDANVPQALSRESSATLAQKTDSQPSRAATTTQNSTAASSAAASPQQSREPSPARPYARTTTSSRASSVTPGTRSRKNSLKHDTSPPRAAKGNAPAPLATTSKTLAATSTPALLPTSSDPSIKAPVPIKSPTHSDHLKDSPRWPVSPRLRSPPPILNKPILAPPRKGDQEPPVISVQRATPSPHPSPQPPAADPQSESELDDGALQPGVRTPVRGGSTSTLETVQEVSPLTSPRGNDEYEEKLEDSIISETSSQIDPSDLSFSKSFVSKANLGMNESGSESGSIKGGRRSGVTSAPPLTTRQSSVSAKSGVKGKAGEGSLQSMTVETETVASIPQVALTAGLGQQGSNGSLRTKPSSETIRPKKEKEKKKVSRKQPAVTQGTASTKADIFEAKVASAVEEANSSDSDETFVYDSNPPDGRDRRERFHSRTPSATSMVSQVDRNGMRSIHSVMESSGTGPNAVKKNMKFVNSYNSNGNDSTLDDDGKGTGRSNVGSARGTARHHHHIGRWGRNGGSSHPSLFAEESPFTRNFLASTQARQSSRPSSPRVAGGRASAANGKRGMAFPGPGYDLDDTTGADDETTPLIQSATIRRPGRVRRGPMSMRGLEQQSYRSPPSVLNRFASCLVLTVMLMLVISGAIGFMFATSQPLTDIELVAIKNVVASEQELMLDITVRAHNPNVVVVAIDSADIEVFAKSPNAGTDSEWWRRPNPKEGLGSFQKRRRQPDSGVHNLDDPVDDSPVDDSAPLMRLGNIVALDSPLSFEGSFFHHGNSSSTGELRLHRPGNGTDGGSERWEHILEDQFELILDGVLKYTLPLSGKARVASIVGRTTVRPNAKDDPAGQPKLPNNGTGVSISFK
ncbi:hypothetical protein GQ53DRAFT_822201 [Thozetella sp. PMI_491]|nr:hypothetical protein GQ53DRAFT_822201 [Thozetella sp. PMI_491]